MSIREGIAEIARCGDWCVVERCKIYKDDCGLCVADQILTYLKAEVEKGGLTDEEFLEWCGSHIVKGCGKTRPMEGADRKVSICEDCRVQAQIDKFLKLLEE